MNRAAQNRSEKTQMHVIGPGIYNAARTTDQEFSPCKYFLLSQ
jgi:hypothetical protein